MTTMINITDIDILGSMQRIRDKYEAKHSRKIVFNPAQAKMMVEICAWISGQSKVLDNNRGLYLWSKGHGTGKTMVTLWIKELYDQLHASGVRVRPYKVHAYDNIFNYIRYHADDEILTQITAQHIIDDYGYQGRSLAKCYGNDDYVADLVISELSRKVSPTSYRPIMTGNYNPEFLVSKGLIHPGTASRISGMFNVVEWESGDHRSV